MKTMPPPIERRTKRRIPVRIPVGIYLKDHPFEVIDAEILDISEGGAFISSTTQMPMGREILIEIKFAETKVLEGRVIDSDDGLSASLPEASIEKSTVRWAKGNSHSGFGIEFGGLQADKKKFLLKLIAYFEQLEKAGCIFSGRSAG